jgi:solute carrier family 26 (sodium-independent sulfate anion transporter), member 11
MASARVKIGHFLAKVLGIKLNELDDLTRGESVFSVQTVDSFIEREPTSGEWIRDRLPSAHDLVEYTRSLFPFTYWIGRYNLQWFLGDLVAGNSSPYVFCEGSLTKNLKVLPLAQL